MKAHSWIRVGVCAALAIPMYFVARSGATGAAILGYVLFVGCYLFIQVITDFRHPLHGVLFIAVFAVLYALIAPAFQVVHVLGGHGR
jgi:hypothetical protein